MGKLIGVLVFSPARTERVWRTVTENLSDDWFKTFLRWDPWTIVEHWWEQLNAADPKDNDRRFSWFASLAEHGRELGQQGEYIEPIRYTSEPVMDPFDYGAGDVVVNGEWIF